MVHPGIGSSAVLVLLVTGATSVSAQNLVQNGRFNSGVEQWTQLPPVELSWIPSDCHGSSGSGSGLATNTVPGANSGAIQCVTTGLVVGQTYDLRAWFRVPSGQTNTGYGQVFVWWYGGADCSGTQVTGPSVGPVWSSDSWLPLDAVGAVVPVGTQSATVYLNDFNSSGPGSFLASFDSVFLGPSGTLFEDDFESGDLSAWSSASP